MASTDRIDGFTATEAIKAPCRVAAAANIVLANEQTIDGVAVVAEDRVLVYGQTDATTNGIYICKSNADWVRAKDFDGSRDVREGTLVWVAQGTTNADTFFQLTTVDTVSIGTDDITFLKVNGAFTGTFQSTDTGSVERSITEKLMDFVSVRDFGAEGDGIVDDTTAITSAVATGKHVFFPKGTYLMSSTVTVSTTGQVLWGEGRYLTQIDVDSSFTGSYVFNVTASSAVGIKGIGMTFTVPDTSTIGSLTVNPTAIYSTGCARMELENLLIMRGTDGIVFNGNCGGSYLRDIQLSCFGDNVFMDNCLDTVRVDNVHVWPFGLTTNQQTAFQTENSVYAFDIGRVDHMIMNGCLTIGPLTRFVDKGNGNSFAQITNTDFDNRGSLVVTAGKIMVTNCAFTLGVADRTSLTVNGANAQVLVSNSWFRTDITLTGNQTSISHSDGYLSVSDCMWHDTASTANRFIVTFSGADYTLVTNNRLRINNVSSQVPMVLGGPSFASGNVDISGVANLIATSVTTAVVMDNPGAGLASGVVADTVRTKYFTGALDGSGDATIAHGITTAQEKVLDVNLFAKGVSGEAIQIGDTAAINVDGTNINVAAGATYASDNYRCVITYVDFLDTNW